MVPGHHLHFQGNTQDALPISVTAHMMQVAGSFGVFLFSLWVPLSALFTEIEIIQLKCSACGSIVVGGKGLQTQNCVNWCKADGKSDCPLPARWN